MIQAKSWLVRDKIRDVYSAEELNCDPSPNRSEWTALHKAARYIAEDFGKLPGVKKVVITGSIAAPYNEEQSYQDVDLGVALAGLKPLGLLQETRVRALERLRSVEGIAVEPGRVNIAILEPGTRRYLGSLSQVGESPLLQPVEGYHFDPDAPRVTLFKREKEIKKKVEKFDPEWAKAKKSCRLNEEEIRMAKELGLKPRSLMKNIPSPKQQWKLPVKLWVRELYEKRHPGKGLRPELPLKPVAPLSPEDEEIARRQFEEQEYWDDYAFRNDLDGWAKPGKSSKGAKPGQPLSGTPEDADDLAHAVFVDVDVTDDDVLRYQDNSSEVFDLKPTRHRSDSV